MSACLHADLPGQSTYRLLLLLGLSGSSLLTLSRSLAFLDLATKRLLRGGSAADGEKGWMERAGGESGVFCSSDVPGPNPFQHAEGKHIRCTAGIRPHSRVNFVGVGAPVPLASATALLGLVAACMHGAQFTRPCLLCAIICACVICFGRGHARQGAGAHIY